MNGDTKMKNFFLKKSDKREEYIRNVAQAVKRYVDPVIEHFSESFGDGKVFIQPTPFQIAEYYGIKCQYIPSYLNKDKKMIYISDVYKNDSYGSRQLCAHELGHFFLHDSQFSAMNNDSINEFLDKETIKEYEANVFSILLMPQIMGADYKDWHNFSPRKLNRILYDRVMK